ncbi:hypothetical protein CROQUDRAFT_81774 [Cronartium quercuum f. sp. fusiforme G11]|uniref:DUF2428 domain-containing protein n=1 Tax=Cronartium quercuum f. sp. fusiforme G11 TaxID=708437 RepID=A0A9P6NFM6_9BASI|nr:hypothetical protein CROQUDRAFT_81774 [Cronartium quercuum f. sp. fusiforme G11]
MSSKDTIVLRLEAMKDRLMQQSMRQLSMKDPRKLSCLPLERDQERKAKEAQGVTQMSAYPAKSDEPGLPTSNQLERTEMQDRIQLKDSAFRLALRVLLGTESDLENNSVWVSSKTGEDLPPSTDAGQEALLSLEIINILLREVRTEMKAKPRPLLRRDYGLSETFEVAVSKSIWRFWNSSLGIAHKIKATLTNLMECSAAFCSTPLDRPVIKTFLGLIKNAVFVEKRTLALLLYLLPVLSVEEVLRELSCHVSDCSEVLLVVLNAIGDDKLASVSGQLAIKWTSMIMGWDSRSTKNEVVFQADDSIWINPSLSILFCRDERKRQYFCQYYLVGLFKQRPNCFTRLSREVAGFVQPHADLSGDVNKLSAVISLACAGRSVGNAVQHAKLHDEKSTELINDAMLSVCLSHPSKYLRSSSLSLICQSTSSATPLPAAHLSLLSSFFRWNLGEVDAELKQNIKSNLVALLGRLRDSSYAANKKMADLKAKISTVSTFLSDNLSSANPNAVNLDLSQIQGHIIGYTTYIEKIKAFLDGLKTLWLSNMTISSPYRTQIASLGYLKMLLDSGPDPLYLDVNHQPEQSPSDLDKPRKDRNLQKISRFPFELRIIDSSFIRSLVAALNSTYDDIRNLAFTILQASPTPLPGYQEVGSFDREIVDVAIEFSGSKRASETCTGTLLLRLVVNNVIMSGSRRVPTALLPHSIHCTKSDNPLALFFYGRLDALEDRIKVAENDLGVACEQYSIQGSLMTISSLLACLSDSMIQSLSASNDLVLILTRARDLVERIWNFTKPVLCAAAPDCSYMEDGQKREEVPDHEEARAQNLIGGNEEDDDDDGDDQGYECLGTIGRSTGPKHKTVLSACWRSMKEASALLTEVTKVATGDLRGSGQTRTSLLSLKEISEIGGLFETWLLEIRHRGAFGAIHASYSKLVACLCSLPRSSTYARLPASWLKAHITAITYRKLSFTRRSAGLPYCILSTCQALSSFDPDEVRDGISRILDVSTNANTPIESKIHCLNTLKILHTDSMISSKVISLFIERSYDLAIQSFVSPDWRIRNGALILFSGLTNRVFGSRALGLDRTHMLLCKRESVTDFFFRLPLLHQILLGELKRSIEGGLHSSTHADLQSPLFTVLSLLSLLQNPDSCPAANDFIALVEQGLGSRVSKIRSISADAMTGLVPVDQIPTRICSLLTGRTATVDFNQVHGQLLQVLRLIEVPISLDDVQKNTVSAALHQSSASFLSTKQPYMCRLVYLQIIERLDSRFSIKMSVSKVCKELSRPMLFASIGAPEPGTNSFQTALVDYHLKRATDPILVSEVLSKGSVPMKIAALHFILNHVENFSDIADDTAVKDLILKLCRNNALSVTIRLPALEVLGRGIINISSSDWNVPKIIDAYDNTRVPLMQNMLLIIMARGIVNKSKTDRRDGNLAAWQEAFLNKVNSASTEEQSIDTRLSAAKALSTFSPAYCSLSPRQSIQFLDAAITLLQDDDEDVRAVVIECIGAMTDLSDGFPKVPLATLDILLHKAHKISPSYTIQRIFHTASLKADVEELLRPSRLIFATERLNLYRDDLAELDILQHLTKVDTVSLLQDPPAPAPANVVDSFDQAMDALHMAGLNTNKSLGEHSISPSSLRALRLIALRVAMMAHILELHYQYHIGAEQRALIESIQKSLSLAPM